MRIIAGRARGCRLASPKHQGVRPTTDRVRESLFSIIASIHGDVRDAVVLDGFAGSGALGLEAISRGAAHCHFIEQDRRAARLVRENIQTIRAGDEATLIQRPFAQALAQLRLDTPLDLVFLDPPYHTTLAAEALDLLGARPDLCDEATLVVTEQEIDEPLLTPAHFACEDTRVYSRTRLCFWYRPAQDDSTGDGATGSAERGADGGSDGGASEGADP